MKLPVLPRWYWQTFAIAVLSNVIGAVATYVTIDLMRSPADFAFEARDVSLEYLPAFQTVVYPLLAALVTYYLWPLIRYDTCCESEASDRVKRRVVSAPLVVALLGYAGWLAGPFVFGGITVLRLGRWSTELMSQQVLSPLLNGFLAAIICYLLVDRVFRATVVPRIFPGGHLAEVPGALSVGVRGRLIIFLAAVAFVPLFTMLGLIRASAVRFAAGLPAAELLEKLTTAGEVSFLVFLALGLVLTLILSGTLTRPLEESAAALRRVQAGDLDVEVTVESADEVGQLADGVNEMVAALRDRERILKTFGRVVEPAVRDHLLSSGMERGGELRHAAVVFCDMRGFTALSERLSADEVVETLNEFFTVITSWVRECGGFVDKFIGDALLLVFGLFDDDADAGTGGAFTGRAGTAAAVQCALGIAARLDRLNAARKERGLPPLSVSIGVHSGEVLAGVIGSADRHEYTVIGDTVNVAARLQALSKNRNGALLLSEQAFNEIEDGALRARLKDAGEVALRGRSRTVRVYTAA